MREQSFYKILEENAKKYPDRTAIVYDTTEVSYKMLFDAVVKKALHLQRFEGKRIALYGPTSYRWIVNFFGTILAGKDAVISDFFLPQDMRSKLHAKVNADYVLCSTNQYILSDADAIIIPNADKDDVTGLVYDTNTADGNVIMFKATETENDKAVVISSAKLINAVNALNRKCICTEDDRVLAQIPLNHIFGLVVSFLWPISNGACMCIGRGLRHIDADTFYYEPTIFPGNPSMIEYIKKIKSFNSSLKKIVLDSAACPYRLLEGLMDRDLDVYSIYGNVESCGCIGICNSADGSFELFEDNTVTIAKDGEILFSGRCIMDEYDEDDAKTRCKVVDGVLHTGDYGHFNKEGNLVVTQRNRGIIHLPTGEKICRKVMIEEISALNGIADSYAFLYEDKLTVVVVPINKDDRYEKIKGKIDKYNEKKGYRWEIQRIVLRDKIPYIDGEVDEKTLFEEMPEY